MEILHTKAIKGSTYVIDISFQDEDEQPVVPNSATWTLTNHYGQVVNSRTNVAITPLSTTASIVLSGDDLLIPEANNSRDSTYKRYVTIEAIYTSSLGTLPLNKTVRFEIDDDIAID